MKQETRKFIGTFIKSAEKVMNNITAFEAAKEDDDMDIRSIEEIIAETKFQMACSIDQACMAFRDDADFAKVFKSALREAFGSAAIDEVIDSAEMIERTLFNITEVIKAVNLHCSLSFKNSSAEVKASTETAIHGLQTRLTELIISSAPWIMGYFRMVDCSGDPRFKILRSSDLVFITLPGLMRQAATIDT